MDADQIEEKYGERGMYRDAAAVHKAEMDQFDAGVAALVADQVKDGNPKDAVGSKKWRQFLTIPRQVMWEVAVAMLEGALKYGRHNYRGAGVRGSVYADAAMGHIDQWIEGEDIDPDSGIHHISKAIASLTVLRDAQMNDFWVDDRPPRIADLAKTRAYLQEKVEEVFERYGHIEPHHWTINDPAAYSVHVEIMPPSAESMVTADALHEMKVSSEESFRRAFMFGEDGDPSSQ